MCRLLLNPAVPIGLPLRGASRAAEPPTRLRQGAAGPWAPAERNQDSGPASPRLGGKHPEFGELGTLPKYSSPPRHQRGGPRLRPWSPPEIGRSGNSPRNKLAERKYPTGLERKGRNCLATEGALEVLLHPGPLKGQVVLYRWRQQQRNLPVVADNHNTPGHSKLFCLGFRHLSPAWAVQGKLAVWLLVW